MGIDIEINGVISLFMDELSNAKKVEKKLNKWIDNHSEDLYGWNIEFNNDQIDIEFENPKRGPLEDYIIGLVKFLKYCKKFGLYAQDTLRYVEAWGDYVMGYVWISSDKKIAIISGMTNHGDKVDKTIKWKNVK